MHCSFITSLMIRPWYSSLRDATNLNRMSIHIFISAFWYKYTIYWELLFTLKTFIQQCQFLFTSFCVFYLSSRSSVMLSKSTLQLSAFECESWGYPWILADGSRDSLMPECRMAKGINVLEVFWWIVAFVWAKFGRLKA